GIIAGGDGALRTAKEGSEDDEKAGETDLKDRKLQALDTCIGISAAGGAKYVTGAVAYAKTLGCFTVSVTCNDHTPLGELADVDLVADTGEEVVTGSTRMKAGSAQKMILNMISTGVMVKLGYVYENMMINLRPTNEKLKRRMARITAEICGCNVEIAEELLNRAAWNIKDAVRLFHNTP
ncbi:MAG: N-acetylmuramic acid 6-phosphate etherase, partial [Clostridia bacterium]|nr:N-acetylmuramic acid 6-phosphate etherase [Clostridia bacterium]